jgi:cytochrome c
MRAIIALGLVLCLAACAAPREKGPSMEDRIADGRAMAEANCAGCHAVGEMGDSPLAAAPPFRVLLSRYHSEVLEEELIQGIHIAHPMPEFQFNPQSVDSLIAYLKSIQVDEEAPAQ